MAGYSIIQMDEVPLTDRLGSLLNCGPPRRELDIALGPRYEPLNSHNPRAKASSLNPLLGCRRPGIRVRRGATPIERVEQKGERCGIQPLGHFNYPSKPQSHIAIPDLFQGSKVGKMILCNRLRLPRLG
ncbi:hypothetical protein PCH_Pc22g09620 [Penicillium rubens Wisconsin 54-1255]|uniref:Uncharacterized protein n=1 Tax=Penicillium rubens (strain ATCC 28089 / DSM 1075 / NRRL 1951 / Wisconsin 54-1255) TaxID=500485 RepID=B6HUH4_PENRW|nr:hypothetical protein PCH_Pc22g09620 [Penicillium rubens Wisconsin 54-1255]